MPDISLTMKLHIHANSGADTLFRELTRRYRDACDYISQYVFNNGFPLNFMSLQKELYGDISQKFSLKSQMSISTLKTVTARYKTVKEQLHQHPYRYLDENGEPQYIDRTLEWLTKPVRFSRPQADLVRNRDYSFVDGGQALSINTLGNRIRVSFDVPEAFLPYFDGSWSFGTAKLVSLNGEWYMHIPVSKPAVKELDRKMPSHVVGIDRGLRFLASVYDEKGDTAFFDGKQILEKRQSFNGVRAQLQARGTKSAKRALKRISGRENRWMSDVNHRISKTLTDMYGQGTLFVIEDLRGVSFCEENLARRGAEGRREIRSWAFFQFEQFLSYKAQSMGSMVLKVPADYTSQRCPKCGRIHKANRRHDIHEYICDCCGYRSNDDRAGAMNLQVLGTMYVSGDNNPRFGKHKEK